MNSVNLPPHISINIDTEILDKFRLRGTTITFDDVTDGAVIDSQYTGKGVTFSSVTTNPPSTGHAYARADILAESPRNVLTLAATGIPCFDAYQGAVNVAFASPQLMVSIDAMPVPAPEGLGTTINQPFMEVYDTAGNFLKRILYPIQPKTTGYGTWQRLEFKSSSRNVGSLRLSSQRHGAPYVYGLFDRLFFSASSVLW